MGKLSKFTMLAASLAFVGACTPRQPEPIGKEAVFNKFSSTGSCGAGYGFDGETNLCMPKEEEPKEETDVCQGNEYDCDIFPTDCSDGFEFDFSLSYCVPIIEGHD